MDMGSLRSFAARTLFRNCSVRATAGSLVDCLARTAMVVAGIAASLLVWAPAFAQPIPAAFIGSHFHDAGKIPLTLGSGIGAIRLWDARLGWNYLEPENAVWRFDKLDRAVEDAERQGLEILYPLGLTPRWASSEPDRKSSYGLGNSAPPANITDWEDYVRAVASRYRGRIAAYEIWNEPNRKSFFSGTPADLLRLTCAASRIIRQIDPAAKIVSSSPTDQMGGVNWLRVNFDRQLLECVDALGVHLYSLAHEPPESVLPVIDALREALAEWGVPDFPIWNTEWGWYVKNSRVPSSPRYRVWDADDARDLILRAYILFAASGIERNFHYAWNNRIMGVIEPDTGQEKVAAQAFARAAEWLVGATRVTCNPMGRAIACEILRPGKRAVALWSLGGSQQLPGSMSGVFERVVFADGSERALLPTGSISASASPVLLK